MGCGCSREFDGSMTEKKPEQTTQQQPRVAVVQLARAKPTGVKKLSEILQAENLTPSFLTNISSTGFVSNNDPTPAFWISSLLVYYPQLLGKILSTNNGVNSALVYNAGVPTTIPVEDSFPVGANGAAFYTSTKNGDIWPMILEKCLAQNVGGYDALFTADWLQLWQTTLGVPVHTSPVIANNWSIFRDNSDKKYPMALFEYDSNTGKPVKGFVILKCTEYSGNRIFTLRDMFGNYEHNPSLNNPTTEGDDAKSKAVGYNPSDPRIYYIYNEDVVEMFSQKEGGIIMIYAENNWSYKYVTTTTQAKHPDYFELNVSKKSQFNISVHQSPNTSLPTQYSDIHIEVLQKDNQLFSNFNAPEDGCKPTIWADYRSDDSWAEAPGGYRPCAKGDVDPGVYVISVKARNPQNLPTNLTVSVYSRTLVDLKKLDQTAYGGLRGFLAKRQFIPNTSWNYLVNTENFGDNKVNHGFWWTRQYYVFQCENNADKVWNLGIKFPKLFNFRLGKPNRVGPTEFSIKVPAGQAVLVYLKKVATYDRVNDFGGDTELTQDVPFKFEFNSDVN